MGIFAEGTQAAQSIGFFNFLAVLLIFVVVYLALMIYWKRKKGELKTRMKLIFFVIAILIASPIIIFSVSGQASDVLSLLALIVFAVFFCIVLIFLMAGLFGMKPKTLIKTLKKKKSEE